jgi:hypothetical protein
MITTGAGQSLSPDLTIDPVRRKTRWRSLLQLPALLEQERRLVGSLVGIDNQAFERGDLRPCRPALLGEVLCLHGLLPFLAVANQRDEGIAAWSAANGIEGTATRAWRQSMERTALLDEEFDRLGDVLTNTGVPWVPLKGAFTGRLLYEHQALRPMSDLDVLVPEGRLVESVAALRAAGYTEIIGQEPNGPSKDLHHPQLWHSDRRVPIEIHHHVAPGVDFERLLGLTVSPGRHDLSTEAHLAHRLLELAKDGWARKGLVPYLDGMRLASHAAGRLERMWALVDDVGLTRGAAASAATLIRVCGRLGLPVPAPDLDRRSSLALSVLCRWQTRQDAVLRVRYLPRWHRRLTRFVQKPAH